MTNWWSSLFKKNQFETFAKFSSPEEGDQAILRQLKKVGANLEKPREVLQYLYVPTQEASHHAAAVLRGDGFTVTERASADAVSKPPNPWLVLATKVTVVSSESVSEMRTQFEQLARETHGDYDGWEAAAQP